MRRVKLIIERISIVSKVIRILLWFCYTLLCDWLRNFALLSWPIRGKTQTIRDFLTRVFPRLAQDTCICFEFWLVHWVICLYFVVIGWGNYFGFGLRHSFSLKSTLNIKYYSATRLEPRYKRLFSSFHYYFHWCHSLTISLNFKVFRFSQKVTTTKTNQKGFFISNDFTINCINFLTIEKINLYVP